MRHINIRDINLYHIEIFLVVAEYENITHAANILHVSQSMVSKNIIAMENILGLQLFIRNRNSLKLTPSGKILRKEFQNITNLIELALEKAHSGQMVTKEPLKIAIPESVSIYGYCMPTIENYLEYNREFSYQVESYAFGELQKKLISYEVDVVLTSLFDLPYYNLPQLEYARIIKCPLAVFMLDSNPLTKLKQVTIKDLKSSDFIMPSASINSGNYTDLIVTLCKENGFVPNISKYVHASSIVFANMRTENEIYIADRFWHVPYKNIKYYELPNTESGVILIWRKREGEEQTELFVKKAIEYWNERNQSIKN